jgi:hypothetical protein
MKEKSPFNWITRAMGVVLVIFSIRAAIIAFKSQRAGAAVYLVDATGFFFASCLLLASFNFKKLSVAAGVLTLASLLSSDLTKWKDGTKSIQDVLTPWSFIAAFLAIVLTIIWKRSRKGTTG